MAKYTSTMQVAQADDVAYRAWVQGVHNAILGSGRAEATLDTGQMDISTIVRPGAGAWSGYRMYQLNDGVIYPNGHRPLLKFEAGRGGQLTQPMWRFTFGTLTNGAGAFVGPSQVGFYTNTNWSAQGAATPIRASGILGGGGFWIKHAHIGLIGMEHGWYPDGSRWEPFAQFWNLYNGNTTLMNRYMRCDGTDAFKAFYHVNHNAYATSNIGGNIYAHPLKQTHGEERPPSKMFFAADGAEFIVDVEYQFTHYGAAANFWASGLFNAPYQWSTNPSFGLRYVLRWEE